ncbi:MAG TPA: hypothetical protein VFG81_17835 [Anaerolineales bacterium]|nr:hypothetical protein [Anaerolineales bacterium]
MRIRPILFVAFTFLFSACSFSAGTLPAEETSPTGQSLPTSEQNPLPTPTSMTAGELLTYTDDFAGFSLDYPANWYLESSALIHAEESFGYNVSIATWDILNPPTPSGKGQDGIPEGGTKIDVAVTKQAMTLEEAIAQQEQIEGAAPILARTDVTLASGLPAVILDFEGPFGPIRTLITVLNGNIIYVSGYGNLENFESIALTLRPK